MHQYKCAILTMYLQYYMTVMVFGTATAGTLPETYLPQNGNTQNNPDSTGNRRAQQDTDSQAAILRLEKEVTEDGYHYAYETSNDIQAEESGDTFQTRGAFAYRGDDGKIYSVTFTAGEDGFRAHGDHLPLPPPTPDDILIALKKNEQDEAAGIFDDGQYRPEESENGRSDAESGYKYK